MSEERLCRGERARVAGTCRRGSAGQTERPQGLACEQFDSERGDVGNELAPPELVAVAGAREEHGGGQIRGRGAI